MVEARCEHALSFTHISLKFSIMEKPCLRPQLVTGVTSRQRSFRTGLTSSLARLLLVPDVDHVFTTFWPEGHSEEILKSSETRPGRNLG